MIISKPFKKQTILGVTGHIGTKQIFKFHLRDRPRNKHEKLMQLQSGILYIQYTNLFLTFTYFCLKQFTHEQTKSFEGFCVFPGLLLGWIEETQL